MDISLNSFSQIGHLEKGTTDRLDEHFEAHGDTNDKAWNHDLEKPVSYGSHSQLSHIPKEDQEYFVPTKTWAVVVVRNEFYSTI